MMSLKTVNFITIIADLLSASIVKNIIILSKFVIIFKNTVFALFQNIIIIIICSKTISFCIIILIAILSTQFDSQNTKFAKKQLKKI